MVAHLLPCLHEGRLHLSVQSGRFDGRLVLRDDLRRPYHAPLKIRSSPPPPPTTVEEQGFLRAILALRNGLDFARRGEQPSRPPVASHRLMAHRTDGVADADLTRVA